MSTELIFAITSTFLVVWGNFPYFIDIWRWRSYPHPITFLIWTILVWFNTFILFASSEYLGFIPSLAMFLCNGIFVVFGVIHFKRISVNWFDWFCFWLALTMILYWFISWNVLNTVLMTILIDFIAYLPVFKKGWLAPWSETAISYFIPGFTQVFTLLSLDTLTLENSSFWFYLFLANITFVILLLSRRYYLKWWNSIFE